MNFSDLKTELAARGFDFLSDARRGTFVNDAYFSVARAHTWDWLKTTASGTAPLTVSDLGTVLWVVDSTHDTELTGVNIRDVIDRDTDLTTTGTATYWYRDGATTIRTYPVDTTSTFSIGYIKFPAALTGTDTPALPTRHHSLIVDKAVVYAHRDRRNFDLARDAQQAYLENLGEVVQEWGSANAGNPQYIVRTQAWDG